MIKPYFPPSTLRADFTLEQVISRPSCALHTDWATSGLSIPRVVLMPAENPFQDVLSDNNTVHLFVPKPPGAVNRIGGYTLQKVWADNMQKQDVHYAVMQVFHFIIQVFYVLT